MKRRIFAQGLLALLLLSTATVPAFAKDGKDDGGDYDSGGGDGGDDSGGDDNSGSGGGGGGNSGGDDGPDDSGGDHSGGGDGTHSGSGGDHEDAKHAVDAKDALPLGTMLTMFKRYGDYTVIDVKLSESNRTLLYVFKFIDSTGNVRKAYFDAKTGTPVN